MSNMIKHIFFDFNGTLINDIDLCLELLNNILKRQNKRLIEINEYKNIFTFPIKDYYIRAGVDLVLESYESLAVKYIKEYQPRSLECGLFDGVIDTICYLKEKGIRVYILSASERNNLIEQCKHYKLYELFDDILGLDNINASSKIDIALDYINNSNINPEDVIFIGDTIHDYEVAQAIGVKCLLVSCGHQSKKVLEEANVPILDNVNDIRRYV